jgi:hypothetical protein
MRKKLIQKIALAASLGLAMAFPLSCSTELANLADNQTAGLDRATPADGLAAESDAQPGTKADVVAGEPMIMDSLFIGEPMIKEPMIKEPMIREFTAEEKAEIEAKEALIRAELANRVKLTPEEEAAIIEAKMALMKK